MTGEASDADYNRDVLPALSSDPLPALQLLNNLAEAGYLSAGLSNVQGGHWRPLLTSALLELLDSPKNTSLAEVEDRRLLGQCLSLLPYLAEEAHHFTGRLVSIIDRLRGKTDLTESSIAREDWESDGPWNDAHMLGLLLQCAERLAVQPAAEEYFKTHLLGRGQTEAILRAYHWNREIMISLASLMERCQMTIE